MAYSYTNNCDDSFIAYPCELCPTKERGRVRGAAFILEGVTISDPSNAEEWANKVDLNQVFLIPNTQGTVTFTPSETPGFGGTEFEIDGYDYVVDFKDKNLIDSCTAAIQAAGNKKMKFAYVTETQIWMSDTTVSASLGAPVEDNIKSIMSWNYQVKWFQTSPVCPQTAPQNTFDRCITVT